MPSTLKTLSALSIAAAVAVTGYVPVANAFNFGDMMNPGRWLGGKRDRNDDYYNDDWGPYGGGPYGPYGGGPWGGGPWGGGPYGGAPGYGYPGAYGAPYAAPVAPAAPAAAAPAQPSSSGGSKAEIDALKRRIEELESRQQPAQSAPASEWPSAPAFRPMNQY